MLNRPMRRDLPGVAPGIEHRRPSIAVRRVHRFLERRGARIDGAAIRFIRVFDIHIKETRHRLAPAAAVANHHNRVPDPYFSRYPGSILASGIEHSLEKSDQAGNVAGENSRRESMPAVRCEVAHLPTLCITTQHRLGVEEPILFRRQSWPPHAPLALI
jgi:hypothetical protein